MVFRTYFKFSQVSFLNNNQTKFCSTRIYRSTYIYKYVFKLYINDRAVEVFYSRSQPLNLNTSNKSIFQQFHLKKAIKKRRMESLEEYYVYVLRALQGKKIWWEFNDVSEKSSTSIFTA
jgi:hypothetical protein